MKSRHDDNKENVPESQMPKQQTISRRTSLDASSIWVDNAKLDHEVFTKSPDHSRSRTGRKIYTSYNGKELRSQTIPSRKSANENMEKDKSPISELEKEKARLEYPRVDNITSIANLSRMIDTKNVNDSSNRKEGGIRERDVLLLGSESVLRVDIPLTIGNNENANISTSTTISSVNVSPRQTSRLIKKKVESNDIVELNTKKSKQSDRSRSRGISSANNPERAKSGSIPPRRSSSKFGDTANTGTNGRASNAKRRSNAKNVNSRNRSAHKSRDPNTTEAGGNDRNKNVDTNSETSASGQTNTRRNLSNNRRTSEGKRRSKDDRKLKITEAKIDKQNVGTQSGSWSRTVNSFGK
ncbi:putative threonine-rich gpi-anchored glyco isoform x10 [Lasius niger]|uniref:Putative threonine-rich gpi-anchored glyco isoform x10 n=1 Tax=Lasius niger TaxID=67767 RepID=A0A0J7K8J1_LASNI|nr:putative threonine-rich gpi-anchored glyco isoform x10 [Lasius niger]